MDNHTDYSLARTIMTDSMIGKEELRGAKGINLATDGLLPEIKFSPIDLEEKKEHYYLILGIDKFADGSDVTIRNMIELFGKDPFLREPCFYNQDWYDNERFIDIPMKREWFLIRKQVYEDSRSRQPQVLKERYRFPSAIVCAYSFFVAWLSLGVKLWYHDYVWCSDEDHNGDRIYVGKYHDVEGINKNGFSIHRHLSLRDCYGCID